MSHRPLTSTTRLGAIELALADYEALFGHPLVDECPIDPLTGELLPVTTVVTDSGGPFRSLSFELFITSHPELRHVRTRVKGPGQTGHANAGSGPGSTSDCSPGEISDALELVERAEDHPDRVQPCPPSRGHRLQPAPRRPPRHGRPQRPQLSRDRNPAKNLTRDTTTQHQQTNNKNFVK